MITGDINADLLCVPSLRTMVEEEGWTDLGAVVSIWGKQDAEPTCQVHAGAKPTRTDFVVANQLMLPAVADFRVHRSDEFPTHAPVQVK